MLHLLQFGPTRFPKPCEYFKLCLETYYPALKTSSTSPEQVDTTKMATGNNFTTSVPTRITCFPFCYTSNKFHSPLHPYKQYIILQSSSCKMKLAGNGERKKQSVGGGYAVGSCFLALDISDKYEPQIHWPLKH